MTEENQNLANIVSLNTKPEEFGNLVENFLTPSEKKELGGTGQAGALVTDACAYMGVFAAEAASFDENAFAFVNQVELNPKQIKTVFNFLIRTHLFEPFIDEDLKQIEGRYAISQETKELFYSFLTEN